MGGGGLIMDLIGILFLCILGRPHNTGGVDSEVITFGFDASGIEELDLFNFLISAATLFV